MANIIFILSDGFVNSIDFYYSSAFLPSKVSIFGGPMPTGDPITSMDLVKTPMNYADGATPFSTFTHVFLNFTGVAHSIRFEGPGGAFFDDVTLNIISTEVTPAVTPPITSSMAPTASSVIADNTLLPTMIPSIPSNTSAFIGDGGSGSHFSGLQPGIIAAIVIGCLFVVSIFIAFMYKHSANMKKVSQTGSALRRTSNYATQTGVQPSKGEAVTWGEEEGDKPPGSTRTSTFFVI